MLLKTLLLAFGVFAGSTAVIMIKACQVNPVALAAYRLLVAVMILSPLFLRDLSRHRHAFNSRHLLRTLLPGLALGLHFISWNIGARMTLTANASLIVNFTPVVMPFFLFFMIRERLTVGEALGTMLALAGVVLLAGGDFHLDPEHFKGDLVCFASMLVFSLYLALGRANRHFPSLWLYVVPLYLTAGIVCLVVCVIFGQSFAIPTRGDLLLSLGLGFIPTVMAHSIMNYSMKHMRGQFVTIANLGQFIFAGIMAYFVFSKEAPHWNFYIAAGLVVAGAIYALKSSPSRG